MTHSITGHNVTPGKLPGPPSTDTPEQPPQRHHSIAPPVHKLRPQNTQEQTEQLNMASMAENWKLPSPAKTDSGDTDYSTSIWSRPSPANTDSGDVCNMETPILSRINEIRKHSNF